MNQHQLSYQFGLGHTPEAAWLMSYKALRYSAECLQVSERGENRGELDSKKLTERLAQFDIGSLALPDKQKEKLVATGFQRLGELWQLPRQTLSRRFGVNFVNYLLKIKGELPDPQVYFELSEVFQQQQSFNDGVKNSAMLLFPMQRLLDALESFLRTQQKLCYQLRWTLHFFQQPQRHIDIKLSEARLDKKTFFELSRLRFDKVVLTEAVEILSLRVDRFIDMEVKEHRLLDDNEQAFPGDVHAFVDKIRTHLGAQACQGFQLQTETIPELAYALTQKIKTPKLSSTKVSKKTKQQLEKEKQMRLIAQRKSPKEKTSSWRPFWLMAKPQRIKTEESDTKVPKLFWQGELNLLSGAERVASHWWSKPIHRDYFVAEHENGALYWIYFEHRQQAWFVHGVFG